MGKEVMIMEFLNEKNMIVDGVDKYYVSELKRVYGSAEYDGEEFVSFMIRNRKTLPAPIVLTAS